MTTRCFISGHMDLRASEWSAHYRQPLLDYIAAGADFYLGNARGCDTDSLKFLLKQGVAPSRIHLFLHAHPDALATVIAKYQTQGFAEVRSGFTTAEEREAALTAATTVDIAWYRPPAEARAFYEAKGKHWSPEHVTGTQANLLRRKAN
jgi:hypothetical protein